MMALRRWLTAHYDPSGHSARLYTSTRSVVLAIARLALITLAAFIIFHAVSGFERIVTDRVALNTFAPVMLVWRLVLAHGLFLGHRMFSGVCNMFNHLMCPIAARTTIPLSLYLQEFETFIVHFFTQKRWGIAAKITVAG